MYNDNKYFNEDDEISDDEYFANDEIEEITETSENEESDEDSDDYDEAESDDHNPDKLFSDVMEETSDDEEDNRKSSQISTGQYKPKNFTPAFLRCECDIKLESYKSLCKFAYQGNTYTGKVLKKMNTDEYIFVIDDTNNPNGVLKKIYIPDASFISAKRPKL